MSGKKTSRVSGDDTDTKRRVAAAAGDSAPALLSRRSDVRFRTLFERAGVGMIEIDSDWRIRNANPVYCSIAGRSRDELLGQSCLSFTHPDDIEKSKQMLALISSPGTDSISFEKRYLCPDGSTVWIRSNLARVDQPDGESRFLKVVEDITDQKASEARLAGLIELGDRFRDVEDPGDLAYAAAEILGRTLNVSRAGYGMIDTAAETITIERDWNAPGIKSLAGVLNFRDYGTYIDDLKRGETVVITDAEKDPRTVASADALKAISAQALVNTPVTEHGGIVALLYLNQKTARHWTTSELDFIRDVAERTWTAIERRRVEQELRESERRYREEAHTLEILNGTGAAVAAELDLERVVQMVTDAGVELTGAQFGAFFYNVVDRNGESYTLYILSGVDRSAFENFPMPRNTQIFGPTFRGEGVVRSDDITKDPRYGRNAPYHGMPKGHLPVVSYLAIPVRGRSGEVIGGLFFGHPQPGRFRERHERLMVGIAAQAAIAIDNAELFGKAQAEIEHRIKAEQALTALNETLESRVVEEIGRRSLAEEALRQSQKMETVGQLSGGIAHDFNNLLQIIHGNLSLLQHALPKAEAKLQRTVANAISGAERAASLTRRLLAFSRRQPLDARPADVGRLISDMSELLRRTLGETVKVEMELEPDLPPASVDPNQLENSILNLAINARDAMPDGGELVIATGVTTLSDEFLEVHPDAAPGEYICISVRDTGEGMNPETLARAVEPFFTTKEVGRGTGLGLSMVYGFVRQSGGYVDIQSNEGEGTKIEIFLPKATGAAQSRDPDSDVGEISRGNGEKILLCEDDEDVRRFSRETLSALGYEVLDAGDAAEALDIVRDRGPIDLLFTDVVLPGGKTGADLAREARELQPGLKVLFTTGYARSALDDTRIETGVDLLAKPFSVGDLSAKLHRLLGGRAR